jgi:putative DNA primase/helicase
MAVEASTECASSQMGTIKLDLSLGPAEPEILLPIEQCCEYKEVKIGNEVFRAPVLVKIHKTADEVLKIIPLATVEETGALLHYRDGVYLSGGEAKVEALLHKSFHGYEIFDPDYTPHKVIAHLKGITMASKDKFDANLDLINMKNGLYNWQEKTLYEHSPKYLSLIQIPVNYNHAARCQKISTVFSRVMETEDINKFFEFAGYCLFRLYPIQKVFILLGPGRTGKSYVLDVLRQFIGDANSCSVSLTNLANNRFAGSDLYGKLLDVVNEMDSGQLLSSDLFKQITGGSKDPIRAERKYEHGFNFINFAKLVFATNKLPKTCDNTTGFYRRFEIIRCDHVFTADEYDAETLDHLTDPEELSGFFNEVVGKLPELLYRRAFTGEMSPDEIKEIWEENAEPIVDFADRFIDAHAPEHVVTKEELHEWFLKYCRLVGTTEREWTIRRFNSGLKQIISEFKNNVHDKTYRPTGGRPCKVWYDTRFKIEDFKAFVEENHRSKRD